MPTEELFGAYHFLLETDGASAKDSFDFTGSVAPQKGGLLLPAVQMARDASRSDNAAVEPLDALLIINEISRSGDDGGHDKWIDVLSTDWGADQPTAADYGGGLRSDGDLVIAVIDADMGGDFIL